jgi:hypothetical protein
MTIADRINYYRKAFVAIAGAVFILLVDNGIALPEFLTKEWVENILLLITPALVWLVPNKPPVSP